MANAKMTREERIQNMGVRATTANQQMLSAINKIGVEFKSLFYSIPLYVQNLITSVIGLQNLPDGEKTLEDFYDYDYDDVLDGISDYLLKVLENLHTALAIAEDVQDEMNSSDDYDKQDMADVDAAVELMEDLIQFGASQHGSSLALLKAADNPDRYTNEQVEYFISLIS